jgi:hypothetical protein
MSMSASAIEVSQEWRDLACDWRTDWGRCYGPATHVIVETGTTVPLAARCAQHIEAQLVATVREHPDCDPLEIRRLEAAATAVF